MRAWQACSEASLWSLRTCRRDGPPESIRWWLCDMSKRKKWYKGLMRVITHTSSLLAIGLVLGVTAIQAADPAPSGMRALFLSQLADVEKKMNTLAAAMPAEKYSWRPAPGVRSISEVYTHIAGANYLFASFVGAKPPAG